MCLFIFPFIGYHEHMCFCNRSGPLSMNTQSNLNPFILRETRCGAAAAVVCAAGDPLSLVIKGTLFNISFERMEKN